MCQKIRACGFHLSTAEPSTKPLSSMDPVYMPPVPLDQTMVNRTRSAVALLKLMLVDNRVPSSG
jgi:hypothetical protein